MTESTTAPPAVELERVLDGARHMYDESVDFTLGVEEEFAICDPTTFGLVNRYEDVREQAIEDGFEDAVCGELLASEVEFRTGRCETYAEATRQVLASRAGVTGVMQKLGLAAASSGTHAFADYREQQKIDSPYYRRLVERLQYVAHRNNTFGLHVHVGVQGADRAIAIADALRAYVPELLALSASSPFLDARDSGLASARAMTFSRTFPRGSLAPAFGDMDGYLNYVRYLQSVGSIESYGQMWWSVRPHAMWGTIEFRMFDGQPDVRDTLALTAVARGLVALLAERHDAGDLGEPLPAHLVEENFWRATRYGTAGDFIDIPNARTEPADERIARLVEEVRGAANRADLGLETGLDRALAMLERGTQASLLRQVYERTGSLTAVMAEVAEQTMAPVDALAGVRPGR